MARKKNLSKNENAFLDMIALSEGTSNKGDDGYNVIIGGSLFNNDYADHPRILVDLPRLKIKSTAAGRYQLLARYFDAYRKQLLLPDFSPESQDTIAMQQIKECRALADINAGLLESAINKCARIWASFPGAGYGQREHKIETLRSAFLASGGCIA